MVTSGITTVKYLLSNYKKHLSKWFSLPSISDDQKLENLLKELKDSTCLVIEFPYVDKLFRDSYYNYYSSAHKQTKRDTIRVSLFTTEISKDDLFDQEKQELVQFSYVGFFVLRPLNGNFLGRSIISPNVLQTYNFVCCLSHHKSTLFGIPLEVHGFPYSTQDTKMISCAETSIWAITEYFGTKYPEYGLVLPNKIHSLLKSTYYQRSLPKLISIRTSGFIC
ncbi:MAG: hypothetical protein ABUK01_06285 [Leptospirales bacterium]